VIDALSEGYDVIAIDLPGFRVFTGPARHGV